ncbi:SET domain-containing protein SmydA-8 [Anastrepha ludens]|uniref:SET domain-containing protein SmydA-8 n=1 Tax=Anastrepha ludens TaxID=28586 RepID=UPI0023B0346E|nr:SET domain-containing protein SmydA-8 [Anastrepha ludens]
MDMDDFAKKCKIENNDELGRYVTAAADIRAGETCLLEQPILLLAANGDRRCSNCLKLTTEFCRICQVFLLCDNCAYHNEYDCRLVADMKGLRIDLLKGNPTTYGLLKCMILRENPEHAPYYEQLLQMEPHLEERRDTEIWKELQKNSVEPILNSGLTQYLKDGKSINETLLQKIWGIIDVNCFEVRAPDEGQLRGVYPRAALLAHSCVSNVQLCNDENYQMKIFATRDISKGDMLYNCYTNVLLGTDERRHLLKVGKYFDCKCERCEDPTELGSHMSSFMCARCADNKRNGGYIVKMKRDEAEKKPQTQTKTPQQLKSPPKQLWVWQCLQCEHTLSADTVQQLVERAKEEVFHAKDDVTRYELLLAKLTRYFHPNHYILLDIKQNIAAILRSILQNVALQPGRKVYERKVRLCQDIFGILQMILPGISRLKAIVLYEMANTSAELHRMRYGEKEVQKTELVELLKRVEMMLRESIRMLLYEPPETPEGQMTKGMLKELKDLQTDIKYLEEN